MYLQEMNLPIYATKLTMGIIEKKLAEHNLLRMYTQKSSQTWTVYQSWAQFRIEFIKTNHSIQDAAALAIYSPAGIVVHTGDFKVDYTPVFGDAIDLQRFGRDWQERRSGTDVQTVPMQSDRASRSPSVRSGYTFDHIICRASGYPYYYCDICIQCRPCAADH